ncbi:Ubl4b protein [Sesbania bispinosa]|nr:Ubl4b protein [Sesbania bispinosa]
MGGRGFYSGRVPKAREAMVGGFKGFFHAKTVLGFLTQKHEGLLRTDTVRYLATILGFLTQKHEGEEMVKGKEGDNHGWWLRGGNSATTR